MIIPVVLAVAGVGLSLLLASTGKASSFANSASKFTDLQKKSAQLLLKYVNGGGSDSSKIKTLQQGMGVIPVTGKPDAATEARVEEILGFDVIWGPTGKVPASEVQRPKKKPKKMKVKAKFKTKPKKSKKTAAKPAVKPVAVKPAAVKPAVKTTTVKTAPKKSGPLEQLLGLVEKASKTKPKKSKKTAAKPAVKPVAVKPAALSPEIKALPASIPTVPQVPDYVLAADTLDKYLRSGGLDRTKVKSLQKRIGGLTVDGVAGPLTLARASEILHRELHWPAIDAASALHRYYVDGKRNKDEIKSYQKQMGELDVDGLVGPKTKARYKSLTGKAW